MVQIIVIKCGRDFLLLSAVKVFLPTRPKTLWRRTQSLKSMRTDLGKSLLPPCSQIQQIKLLIICGPPQSIFSRLWSSAENGKEKSNSDFWSYQLTVWVVAYHASVGCYCSGSGNAQHRGLPPTNSAFLLKWDVMARQHLPMQQTRYNCITCRLRWSLQPLSWGLMHHLEQ